MTSDESFTHRLSAEDARLVDWLMEHGFSPACIEELPAADRPRARAVLRQFSALDAYTLSEPDESLTDAVLARIDRHETERAAALQFTGNAAPRRRWRMADLVGIAALLMMGAAVLLPIASQMKARNLETACANNLRTLAAGLTSYAATNDGGMPAVAGFGGFLSSPGTYRHSENLCKLANDGYCPIHALNCPGCARNVACYSYRMPAENTPFKLVTPTRMVVAADANPVIELRIDGRLVKKTTISSRNHSERGQNLLFGDGVVEWHISPMLGDQQPLRSDNIWLPRGKDGSESADLKCRPCDPTDNFVAQ